MLTLRVLGSLDLRGDDGQEVSAALAQPKRAALLAYLCVRAPAGYCRRDTLLALFWPEADTEHARAALRGALHFLRRAVGDDVIRTRGDDVGIDGERLTCDATLFERAIADGRLDDALTLYRGDLLEGVHVADAEDFGQWRDDERARLRRAAIDAAKALGAQREAEGDVAGAIDAARRAAALVPDDETLAQRLMVLLDRSGDRAGALRAFDELSARLASAYESDPSPETRALVDAIRRREHVTSSTAATFRAPPLVTTHEALKHLRPSLAKVADEPAATRRTRHRGRIMLAAAAASVAAIAAIAGVSSLRARNGRAPETASTDVVVVLPFTFKGANAVSYLGDGMGRLLTTNLNGAGSMRIIDPVAVQRALDREVPGGSVAGVDSAQARHIADNFGAGLVVMGQVSEAAGRLRVSADVISHGRSTTQIVVDGTSDRLFELVDDLTARLVAAWGTEKGQRLTSLAARTTQSLPALRAYLDGEREFSAGRYVAAVDAYQRAVAADSTFALAYYRLSSALTWTTTPTTWNAASLARHFVGRLSRRDSMLVEARYSNSTGDPDRAERLYRTLVADYPDEIEAWYQLGEVQYHWAGVFGRSAERSEPAFARAIALDPVHVPALVHLARLASATRRPARLDSLRARLASLPVSAEESIELDALKSFTGKPSPDRTRDVARIAALGAGRARRMLPALASTSEDLGAVLAVIHALNVQERDVSSEALSFVLEAQLEVARGRWRAANAVLDRATDQWPSRAAQYRGAFAAATSFPHRPAELAKLRNAVSNERVAAGNSGLELQYDPKSGLYPAQRAYILARLALRAGDSAAAFRALDDALAGGPLAADSASVSTLRQQLRAQLLGRDNRAADALNLVGARVTPLSKTLPLLPAFRSADARFLRAELLHMAGRDREALDAFASFPDPGGYDLVYLAPSHLRRAEILEARGDRAAARGHYERFVALWADSDPELRVQVEQVRRKLAVKP